MTTLVLRTAGSLIGGAFLGPVGAALGGALGASAGFAIDQSLLGGGGRSVEGPRLSDLDVQTSTEGAPIARLYGRARLKGEIFWATHFTERVSSRETRTGGAKGGGGRVEQTTYSYFANFAVGLCEGEIAYVGRIWANGELLDLKDITYRVHKGNENQLPDSLIEAKQGEGNAPAYRGLAYVVFEDLPLADFGNRIPQLTFEVVRSVGALEKQIKSIVMIPGATEFGYDTEEVSKKIAEGEWQSENRHSFEPGTDFAVSLDHLLALCPNLHRIALVVTWFGTDLRAGHCEIRPCVDDGAKETDGELWSVAGLPRDAARQVTKVNERPAYGGTPSDASVIRAIREIRARGLEVVLYPFIMMDVAADNDLPDPYGRDRQPPYPWRGRITCHPAPGEPASVDKTIVAEQQVSTFYSEQTWCYRRFIRHYAQLAASAGGVDAFLIGSELRGLTWIRGVQGTYPFVAKLKELVSEIRGIVGSSCKLTYGADWSEYFGHQPAWEAGTVRYHLDPLWSDPNIDAIGIDNYMPMADWRVGTRHLDADRSDNGLDLAYLQDNIAGGEGYDWYYASAADRESQIRTPITDGSVGKPWVYRYKDLVNWWSNPHFERDNGEEAGAPTDWNPQSKAIWFTELGCPAVHMGANQPNVFPDPKSSESAIPYHSVGSRDDAIQRSMLTTTLDYWGNQAGLSNPVSSVYGKTMVDADHIFLWTWDARPFPAFPLSLDTWSDGNNWQKGHWLNGRLGNAPVDGVLQQLFSDFDLAQPDVQIVGPVVDGFVVDRRMSLRSAVTGLCDAFGISVVASGEKIAFRAAQRRTDRQLEVEQLVEVEEEPLLVRSLDSWESELSSVTCGYKELFHDFRQSVVRYDQPASRTKQDSSHALSLVSTQPVMIDVARNWLRKSNHERQSITFSLPPSMLELEAGDHVLVKQYDDEIIYRINEIEEGYTRDVSACLAAPRNPAPSSSSQSVTTAPMKVPTIVRPLLVSMDLPVLPGRASSPHAPYLAAYSEPWPGALSLYRGTPDDGFVFRQALSLPAIIGRLASDLRPHHAYLWDHVSVLDVSINSGDLASLSEESVLAGGNSAAVLKENGEWEVLQFRNAELISKGQWRLTGLLRGQLGTETAALSTAPSGSRFVLLDDGVVLLEANANQLGKTLPNRLVPTGSGLNDVQNADVKISLEGRGLLPLSPVHLKAMRDPLSGDVSMRWIRRARLEADTWMGTGIPLDEARERYAVRLCKAEDGSLLREVEVEEPALVYSQDMQTEDALMPSDAIDIEIRQISSLVGKGKPLMRRVFLRQLRVAEQTA